jgi:8-amino-7-oxononanoate synthase
MSRMRQTGVDVSRLSAAQKREYVKALLKRRFDEAAETVRAPILEAKKPESPGSKRTRRSAKGEKVPAKFHTFAKDPAYVEMRTFMEMGRKMGIPNPFYKSHDGIAGHTTIMDGREYINFANYNYLGLCGHPKVSEATKEAIDKFGTSVSASRIVSGQRPFQTELEAEIADMIGAEDCILFVAGFTTNETTIGYLFGPNDLILHDELAHNSILQGGTLSGARRMPFPHEDWDALDRILTANRHEYEKVVIIVEGVYSMDGDYPDPRPLIEIKNRHKTFLMIDEAHSMGVLGDRGFGLAEHFNIDAADVDIWMGTLSKSFASCGGYIAGCRELVELLRYRAPGAVYSVGLSPPAAAAALAAIRQMKAEPERVRDVRKNSGQFLTLAREAGLDTGLSMGVSIVPVIVGSSALAILLSHALLERGINVQPILHPAVPEASTRLRFFLTSDHTEDEIRRTVAATTEALAMLRRS